MAVAAGIRAAAENVAPHRTRLILMALVSVVLSNLLISFSLVCHDIVDYHLKAAQQILSTSSRMLAAGSTEYSALVVGTAELAEAKTWSRIASFSSDVSLVLLGAAVVLSVVCLPAVFAPTPASASTDAVPPSPAPAPGHATGSRAKSWMRTDRITLIITLVALLMNVPAFIDDLKRDPVKVEIIQPTPTPSQSPTP